MKRPAIFLDRDGTLIEEVNFLARVEDLRLFPFTKNAVKLLKDSGFLLLVVTNQSGIARGKYAESDMHTIHDEIQNELSGAIDRFYFCPHMPMAGCECRKPNLGMIDSAMADFEIDLENSWTIGDKNLDVELGKNARLRTALVLTGYGRKHKALIQADADLIAENLEEAAEHIVAAFSGK
ncbi:N/A [soil metagenome]